MALSYASFYRQRFLCCSLQKIPSPLNIFRCYSNRNSSSRPWSSSPRWLPLLHLHLFIQCLPCSPSCSQTKHICWHSLWCKRRWLGLKTFKPVMNLWNIPQFISTKNHLPERHWVKTDFKPVLHLVDKRSENTLCDIWNHTERLNY